MKRFDIFLCPTSFYISLALCPSPWFWKGKRAESCCRRWFLISIRNVSVLSPRRCRHPCHGSTTPRAEVGREPAGRGTMRCPEKVSQSAWTELTVSGRESKKKAWSILIKAPVQWRFIFLRKNLKFFFFFFPPIFFALVCIINSLPTVPVSFSVTFNMHCNFCLLLCSR